MFLSATGWMIAVTVVAGLLALAVIASGWERRPHNAAEWTAAGWPLLPAAFIEQLELLHPPSSTPPSAPRKPASTVSADSTSRTDRQRKP
jgi:hypothetical protein